jgi:hypothetical protein
MLFRASSAEHRRRVSSFRKGDSAARVGTLQTQKHEPGTISEHERTDLSVVVEA